MTGSLVPEERLELSWCRHRRILSRKKAMGADDLENGKT